MPVSDYTPTIQEVGSRLGGRTRTKTGAKIGTFNGETYPTGNMVNELIEDALAVVASQVGSELDEEYWPMAKAAVISYVCMSIEIGYYPETAQHADSAYAAFKDRYNLQIEGISNALNQKRPNERRIVSLRQETLVGLNTGRLDPFANELFP